MTRLRAWKAAVALCLYVALEASCSSPRPPAQKLPMELLNIKRPRKPREAKSGASILGVVLGLDGTPVDFALVAAVNIADDPEDGRGPFVTTSLDRGKFELSALPPGDYGLTVTAPAANGVKPGPDDKEALPAGAFAGIVSAQAGSAGPPMLIRLGAPGLVLRGHLTDDKGTPLSQGLVRAVRESRFEGDHFFAKTDNEGAFVLPVPAADYFLVGQAPSRRPTRVNVARTAVPADLRIALPPELSIPKREELTAWIAGSGGVLTSVDAADTSDLAALKAIVQSARVVGLGQASYTSGDFARLGLRMFRFLVESMGFSTLLIEAGRGDVRALDEYVLRGTGNLPELIAGLGYFSLDTEETAALFSWMRRYNEDKSHKTKLRVAGLDVQRTAVAANSLEDYLAAVDRALLPPVETTLDRLSLNDYGSDFRTRPKDEQDAVIADLESIIEKLEKNRRVYIAKGFPAYEKARDDAVALDWAARVYRDERLRGVAMADMAKRTIDALPRGSKAMVWAHNTQISKRAADGGMGAALAEAYKADYVAIALTFYQGWLRAWDYTSGATLERGTKLFRLAPPGPGTLEGMLDTAGTPLFLADVRKAPPSLSPWFDARLAMWSVGATFVSERRARTRTVLKEAFDGLGFVRKLTSATFTKTGERASKREWD